MKIDSKIKQIICLIILGNLLWSCGSDNKKKDPKSNILQEKNREINDLRVRIAKLEKQRANMSSPLLQGTIDIILKTYYCYPFQVTKNMNNVRIKGNFEVVEGMGGIKMYILDAINYRNWKGMETFDSEFQILDRIAWEGEHSINIGNIENPRDYYIVFDDDFSWVKRNPTTSIRKVIGSSPFFKSVKASFYLYYGLGD